MIDIAIYITYALALIALLSVIVFPLISVFKDFKQAKGGLLGFIGLIALIALAILLSPADQGLFYDKFSIGPTLSKAIGGTIIATYILFGVLILSILYFEVVKWFKNKA